MRITKGKMKKLIDDKGLEDYEIVRTAYDSAEELLKEPGKNRAALLDIFKKFEKRPLGVEWLILEIGQKGYTEFTDRIIDATLPEFLEQYPACKKAYEKAEELLKEPKKNRKGLLDILLELERNKGGIKYLAEEVGEAAYKETLRKIENESARGYILKKEGRYDSIIYLPDIACVLELLSPQLAGAKINGVVYSLIDCLAVRTVPRGEEGNDANMLNKVIVARLEPKTAAKLIAYAESRINSAPKEMDGQTERTIDEIIELIRFRGVR